MPLAGLGTTQCPWEVDGEREERWYLTAAPTTRTQISSTRWTAILTLFKIIRM